MEQFMSSLLCQIKKNCKKVHGWGKRMNMQQDLLDRFFNATNIVYKSMSNQQRTIQHWNYFEVKVHVNIEKFFIFYSKVYLSLL